MIPILIDADPAPERYAAVSALRPPALVAPRPREASFGHVAGRVFAGTEKVVVYVDGVRRVSRPVTGASRFSFSLRFPGRDVRIRVTAVDGTGRRAGTTVRPVFGLPPAARPVRARPSVEDRALARRVRRLTRSYSGVAAAYVVDLTTGRGAAWNAGARFPAASTLKLAIAIEVLRRLRGKPAAGSSLDRLLWRMLVYSDNAAANSLLVWLGGSTSGGASHVNAMMRSIGVRRSLMYGGYAVSLAAGRRIPVRVNEQPAFGIGKYTTAYDLARLHRAVHLVSRGHGPLSRIGGSLTRRDARYLLWVLAHVADRGKLSRFLPGSTSVLHKAGWIATARHDAGLVYWRGGVFAVAVMTWRAGGVGTGSDVLAGRVARRAYDRYRALRAAATSEQVGRLT